MRTDQQDDIRLEDMKFESPVKRSGTSTADQVIFLLSILENHAEVQLVGCLSALASNAWIRLWLLFLDGMEGT